MITEQDVKIYTRDGVNWFEAVADVERPCSVAWEALERLVMQLTETGTSIGTEFAVDYRASSDTLIAEGTRIAALATALGIFKAATLITFDDVEPGHRAHCTVTVLGVTNGEVEFVADELGKSGCRITYRQGVTDDDAGAGLLGAALTAKSRKAPEVAEIHNTWLGLIVDEG